MTKEEVIKILQNIYFEAPEIKEALQIAIETLSRPSLPSGLDETAEEYALDVKAKPFANLVKEAFKGGAKWMAGQGYSQEEIVEDKSIEVGYGVLPGISPIINLPDSFKPGDKVIVQVRKKQ